MQVSGKVDANSLHDEHTKLSRIDPFIPSAPVAPHPVMHFEYVCPSVYSIPSLHAITMHIVGGSYPLHIKWVQFNPEKRPQKNTSRGGKRKINAHGFASRVWKDPYFCKLKLIKPQPRTNTSTLSSASFI